MTLIRYIRNSRNNETLIAGEFIFRKNKCRDEKVYWKCRKRNCAARITTYNGKVVGYYLKHNHVDNNQDEISRLEGLQNINNYQVSQVDSEASQQIITPSEPFGEEYSSFNVDSYVSTSSGESQRQRVEDHHQQQQHDTNSDRADSANSNNNNNNPVPTSLSSLFKEFSESQEKIKQLVSNLVTSNENETVQTENLRLKSELEEVGRKFKAELDAKEVQFHEEKERANQIQKDLQQQLAIERTIREKLENENTELRKVIKHYEMKFKEDAAKKNDEDLRSKYQQRGEDLLDNIKAFGCV